MLATRIQLKPHVKLQWPGNMVADVPDALSGVLTLSPRHVPFSSVRTAS